MLRIDARIPVRFGPAHEAAPDEAVLHDGTDFPTPAVTHPAGCACCIDRAPMALALATLFQKRARGDVPFFRAVRVIANPEAAIPLRVAVANDPLLTSRFRLAD